MRHYFPFTLVLLGVLLRARPRSLPGRCELRGASDHRAVAGCLPESLLLLLGNEAETPSSACAWFVKALPPSPGRTRPRRARPGFVPRFTTRSLECSVRFVVRRCSSQGSSTIDSARFGRTLSTTVVSRSAACHVSPLRCSRTPGRTPVTSRNCRSSTSLPSLLLMMRSSPSRGPSPRRPQSSSASSIWGIGWRWPRCRPSMSVTAMWSICTSASTRSSKHLRTSAWTDSPTATMPTSTVSSTAWWSTLAIR